MHALSIFLLLIAAGAASAQEVPRAYGHPVDTTSYWTVEGLMGLLTIKERAYVTTEAMVVSSCPRDGCWMDVAVPFERTMKVVLPKEGFRLPIEELTGKRVVMRGNIERRLVDEATARGYAEEEGLDAEGIARIVGPVETLVFDADGMVLFP